MTLPLRETVAVVTGAARGVGKGIAVCLGAAGATVYVTDRRSRPDPVLPGTVEDTAEEVTARGGVGVAVLADHTVEDDVEALLTRVETEHGRLDVLVANAFGGNALPFEQHTPVWELPMALWEHMLTAGVRGHISASRRAVPLLRAGPGGLVVLTSFAGDGEPVMAGNLFYDLAMTATNRFAAGLAHELDGSGVTSLALSPGLVRTEAVTAALGAHPAGSESVEYAGRAVVALATDPGVARHRGRTLTVASLARQYGFTDVDGTQPEALHDPVLPPIRYATYVSAPPEAVFAALATGQGWASWFATRADIDPWPGGGYRFEWERFGANHVDAVLQGRVLAYEPPSIFAFEWASGRDRTTVSFSLSPHAQGTRVEVTERGYGPERDGIVACLDCACGWGEALTLLKFHLEHGLTYGPVP